MASTKPAKKGTQKPPAKGALEPSKKIDVQAEDPRFAKFIASYIRFPSRTDALEKSGLSPEELSLRLKADSNFSRAFLEADELGTDVLEDAAVSRAVLGWDEPVFDMKRGFEVGSIRKYSDSLLMFLLKGRRKKYRGDDQAGGRGVSEEARREMNSIFEEAQKDLSGLGLVISPSPASAK